MSPRRSSRARTTQPPSNAHTAHSVSSSSVSSARTDRATRTDHKQTSPHKSSTPHSLSSEEPEDIALMDRPLTRRRTREQDVDDDDLTNLDGDLDDEMVEEDEVTRCVCGYQEYPGPPSDAAKSLEGDDLSGLFIQCDICKVWQHGGCVGIMDEAASPDEYFCEECRKDLHKVTTSPKGQKYSRYLPVYDQQYGKKARKSSVSKETLSPSSRHNDRNARASVDSLGKRRSTMNSRAAYDEDEVLRKVLEESKHEGGAPASENGNRKKRSRDDSEETKPEVKRQRTSSRSPSNSPVIESEDDSTKASAPKQKPRGAAARSQREKEQREKEREQERTEAANRRKGRAERRKADESEAPEATPTPTEEPVAPTLLTVSAPPEAPMETSKPAPTPRRGGRPPQKSRGRLGRNQYSRDALSAANGVSPATELANSPQPSGTNGNSNGHESSDGTTGHNKTTKSKNSRLHKLSWNDIMRPAGAMQSYIAQRQVEMAGEKASSAPAVQPPTKGEQHQAEVKTEDADLSSFKDLSTTQMMDHLSRDLVHWQKMIIEQKEK
ncbi:Histone deacetylase complex subunit [Didymella glomerata]|uniref:Histone deacetylase complex subunit n=1 Tax=Didymella glomerata TaxID=749621 RepID=A0A9W8X4Z1_9PLEO|nr:Histone deacetylase complex subunit [Didymella glomerata]